MGVKQVEIGVEVGAVLRISEIATAAPPESIIQHLPLVVVVDATLLKNTDHCVNVATQMFVQFRAHGSGHVVLHSVEASQTDVLVADDVEASKMIRIAVKALG